jgi:hypothetical protein
MKTYKHSVTQGALGLAVTLLATSLCLGGEKASAKAQEQPSKTKPATVEKKQKTSARRTEPKRVQITGSSIEYKVEPGKKIPETGLTVTVIDPNSPVNRGYASPIEALKQVPSVYSGR